jgi:hypothetical protein
MFDPYHRWLAIPKDQRPPTYYQLLGVSSEEQDPEVIEEAALRQTSHVRLYQTGPHAQQCQDLLNEIGQAKVTLLHPQKRQDYDRRLAQTGVQQTASQADSSPFDFRTGDTIKDEPASPKDAGNLVLLAYFVLLVLGGLLAF